MPITLQIALKRARMVARRNVQRAVQILLDARVAFVSAVRFAVAASCVSIAACGGGQATAEDIAQHDADMQALHNMTIQAPDCSQGACK